MKNTETDQVLGSVKVTKIFSGIETLPDGFKITAEWGDNENKTQTELLVSDATGSGTDSDPYIWTINDLPIGTIVKFIETGYDADGYKISIQVNETAVTGNAKPEGEAEVGNPDTASDAKVSFKNTYEKAFEFTKIWRDAVGAKRMEWPADKTITVAILQSTGDSSSATTNQYATYTIMKTDLVKDQEISATGTGAEGLPKLKVKDLSDSKYSFLLEGLPAGERNDEGGMVSYVYSVKEDPAVEGYIRKYYLEDAEQHGDSVGDGGVIANDIISYELPQTGGIGTTLFTTLGGLLTVTAGAILTMRRKKQYS